MTSLSPCVDLEAVAETLGATLAPALASLHALYAEVDAQNHANTRDLDLPCHKGCDACCHESVFLTPLEFFAAWDHVQRTLSDEARHAIVQRGLALYRQNEALILALNGPPPEGD